MASTATGDKRNALRISENRLKIIKHALGTQSGDLVKDLENATAETAPQVLESINAGRNKDAERVRLANALAGLVDDKIGVAFKILDDSSTNSARDIALNYGFNSVSSLASSHEAGPSSGAEHIASSANDDKEFAQRFRWRLYALEPTAVLQQMISSDDSAENSNDCLPIHSSTQVRKEVANFLSRNHGFNIRTSSVLTALHDDRKNMDSLQSHVAASVRSSLKLLQRVQALTPTPESIKPLMDEGLTSALQVSSIPKKQFVSRMVPRLIDSGTPDNHAKRLANNIHDHAMISRMRADNYLVQIRQAVRGSGLRAVDGETKFSDRRLLAGNLVGSVSGSPESVDLDAIFDDMDTCECDSCLDVTSPTAYYVDLLQYLRNNDLDTGSKWSNTGQKGIDGTALEKLFQRRPDLQYLQLTCANANTALPMIDLANEIMEAFVIHAGDFDTSGKVTIEAWNIGIEVTNELLASPSHTRKLAYCILKDSVYPLASLPYFQPLDASRLYLTFLGTSRFELIDTFRLAQRQWAVNSSLVASPDQVASYNTLLGQVQDRAAAAEYLGLSPDEYIIITRESLWPIECSKFADSGTIIDVPTFRKDIGVRQPFEYWNYPDEVSMTDMDPTEKKGLSFVKAQFLPRSGLTYLETVSLMATNFVNPMMPTGKDKVLLDSIRFSYRFLQHIVLGIADTKQRNQAIATFLFNTEPWVQNDLLSQVPLTGNPLVKPGVETPSFSEKDIAAWTKKWFDCLGKLTVLDDEAGPRLPIQGYLVYFPPKRGTGNISSIRSSSSNTNSHAKVLGYLDNTGELRDDEDNLVGFVWVNSQLYYGGLQLIHSTYPSGNLNLYQVAKQKGTPTAGALAGMPSNGMLVRVNPESYLVHLEEKPSTISWRMSTETCSIDNTEIIHLNGESLSPDEWDRINRFIRLYKRLQSFGWTIPELDAAMIGLWKSPEIPPTTPTGSTGSTNLQQPSYRANSGFSFSDFKDKGCGCGDDGDGNGSPTSPCDPSNFMDITPGFLKELMSVQKLEKLTGIDLEQLLCLWSDIGTFGGNSLYSRLFLTHDLEAMDPVFLPDDNGNYLSDQPKIGDHIPVIVAAFHLTASIFDCVLQRVELTRDSIMTVSNLTRLYRHVLLSNILGIKPDILLMVLDLFPNPYSSASTTLSLDLLWSRMLNASYTIQQLRYIILSLDDPLRPIGPAPVTVLRTTQTLINGLMAIDSSQPDLTEQEQAVLTMAQLKAKATMLFSPDVVEDIIGLTEGTEVYTTNAPAGLVVDATKISSKIIYKDPLTPPNRKVTLSITGCLTDAEMSTALAQFLGNSGWSSALQRLQKQAQNLVKNTLGGIFESNIADAIQTLTQGDVASSTAADGTTDPGTAPAKRVYFMTNFMPYLRSYLYAQFINTTMSAVASVSSDICSWLLSNVIKVGNSASQQYAMQVLMALHSTPPSDPSAPWIGYLVPPSSDTYVFYGYGDTQPLPLMLNGVSTPFVTQNEDPSNLWWTAPASLVGGSLVTLTVSGQTIPGDLQWSSSRSGVSPIPASALVPDDSVGGATNIFAPLLKASMVIQGFSLTLTEVEYFQTQGADFCNLDFNCIKLEAWKRLLAYCELRNSLVSRKMSLIDLFKWAHLDDTATVTDICQNISNVTTWDVNILATLIDKPNLNFLDVKLFRNEKPVSKLSKMFAFMTTIGITDISSILSWTDLKLDFNPTWSMAKSIRQTIRGKYTASDYENGIKPTHDQLRKNQRDALIAYLLVRPGIQQWGVTDADGLFEFFLIDVQMGSCMQTSRTKQAISSVQLFVKRCMLGLEERYGIANDALDSQRWQWMSQQTVWTANRKVFLWPENWMVSSLRDDKTPIYADMESGMLQRDVNPGTVIDSFNNYVNSLSQIAHLRAVGVYVEKITVNGEDNHFVIHCAAMTIGSPYLFFYRNYDTIAKEWTPWIRISVDIPVYSIEYPAASGPLHIITKIAKVERPKSTSTAVSSSESSSTETVAAAPPTLAAPDNGGTFGPPLLTERQPMETFIGCYVVPVAWQYRTLVFIGEITQKTAPNTDALSTNFGTFTNPSSTSNANGVSPLQFWEIKLSWTEYRNNKWSQKQIASEPFQTVSFQPSSSTENTASDIIPIDRFQFYSQIVTNSSDNSQYISIEIWRYDGSSLDFVGNYVFNGVIVQKGSLSGPTAPTNWTITSFQLTGGRSAVFTSSSLQKSDDGTSLPYVQVAPSIAYNTQDPNGVFTYLDSSTDLFYHPFSATLVAAACNAIQKSDIQPIESVFQSLQSSFVDPAFGTGVSAVSADGVQYLTYSELSKPYTNYNWELGFFAPVAIANAYLTAQQFDQAFTALHYVFNPYADGSDITRVWQWYPFKMTSSKQVLETLFDQLSPRQYNLNISQWRDHPFQPFVVGRGRIVAYMKWTVMMYIQVLIAYGDMYFRRQTLEDIPLAIQLYVLASHLYGPAGETIPKRGKIIPQTYESLRDKWDAFSNAVVQLEIAFPFSNQTSFPFELTDGSAPASSTTLIPGAIPSPSTTDDEIALANIYGFAASSYFCVPSNPNLQALRATIDQRLYNIRNCLDIDGRPMPLVLWDAPLDPGQLVAAVASGLSIDSALSDLNTSLPNYRFTWLMARALEITSELKSLEATFLSIKEKRDSEGLQLLRSNQEVTMSNMVMDLKKMQLDEAKKTLIALESSQESSKLRFQYYTQLSGVDVQPLGSTDNPFTAINVPIDTPASTGDLHLNTTETQEETQSLQAQLWNQDAATLEIMAGILHALPSFNIHTTPMGCGIEIAWGMPNLAAGFGAQARQNQAYAGDSSFSSSQAGRKANYLKQYQDRVHQLNLAGLEYNHINTQIDAQNARINITNIDIANQQKIIDNAQEVNAFLKNKYTNDELYSYLETTTRTAMYQTYTLAYDLAKKAELAFRYERRTTPAQNNVNFVTFGYFNQARDGLQASHQLYLALKSMDAAFQETRGYDFEITKSISLRLLNPFALLALRENATCTFEVPEVLFDMDFPGHFFRRIKTVSLTMPCVVGPYVGVNATLRLLQHRYRADPQATSSRDYVEDTSSGGLDRRFSTNIIPIDAVATSSGQNDSGAFELSLKDERYLPFEGAGVISTWQITLPPVSFRPFDYRSIMDVVLSIRYTACDGGAVLQKAASDSVVDWVGTVEDASSQVGLLALLDIRAEFAAEWAKLSGPLANATGDDVRTLVLRNLMNRLPSYVAGRDATKVHSTDVSLVTTLGISQAASLAINFKYTAAAGGGGSESDTAFDSGPLKIGSLNMFTVSGDKPIGDWALKVTLGNGFSVDSNSRMWLIVRYRLVK